MTTGLNFNFNQQPTPEQLLAQLDAQRARVVEMVNNVSTSIKPPEQGTQLLYPVECVNKKLFNEYLKIQHGISEDEFFADYKLFLDAQQELASELVEDKKEEMKNKIKNANKSNSTNTAKPSVDKHVVGDSDTGDSVQPDGGHEPTPVQKHKTGGAKNA